MVDMKKILIAVLTSIFLCSALTAETTFKSVCYKLAEHPNMTGKFTQVKTISKLNRSLNSSGTFIFSLDGIMWKTEKPFPSTLAVGMTSVVQTMANGKQTVIDASTNQIFTSISSTLSAMFRGDEVKLSENFNVNFSINGSSWTAVLSPKDKAVSSILSSIEVGGNYKESFAEMNKIVMTEATKDTITYSFTEQKYPKELTADEKAYFIAK